MHGTLVGQQWDKFKKNKVRGNEDGKKEKEEEVKQLSTKNNKIIMTYTMGSKRCTHTKTLQKA